MDVARTGRLLAATGAGVASVERDGTMRRVTQWGPPAGAAGDPAAAVNFGGSFGVAVANDGTVYAGRNPPNFNFVSDVWSIEPPLPGRPALEDARLVRVGGKSADEVYVFDELGRHQWTEDWPTGIVRQRFLYEDGKLSAVLDRDGRPTLLRRNLAGEVTSIEGPDGHVTTVAMDANGYLLEVVNPNGEVWRTEHDAAGLLERFETGRGFGATMTYDAEGRLTSETDDEGGVRTLSASSTPGSRTVTVTTAEGLTRSYEIEQRQHETKQTVTDSAGKVQVTTRARKGSTTTTHPDGSTSVRLAHADAALRAGSMLPDDSLSSGADSAGLQVDRAYLVTGGVTERVCTSVTCSERTYEDEQRTWTTLTSAAIRGVQTLTSAGRLATATPGDFATATLTRDAAGRVTEVTLARSDTSSEAQRTSTLAYDLRGNLTSATDAEGHERTFTHDDNGRVLSATFPDGGVVSFVYDDDGNLTELTPPGRPTHRFVYDNVGQTTEYDPPDLVSVPTDETTYVFDLDRRLDLVTRPDGSTIDVDYDSGGRRDKIAIARGDVTFTYDSAGRLSTLSDPEGGSLALGYGGRLVTQVARTGKAPGTVQFDYGPGFRLVKETVSGFGDITRSFLAELPTGVTVAAKTLSVEYAEFDVADPTGVVTTFRNGAIAGTSIDTITTTRATNEFAETSAEETRTGTTLLLGFTYERDRLGRIISLTEDDGTTVSERGFHYDERGRLDEVRDDGVVTETYTWDANGNRLSANLDVATYDDQDRLVSAGDYNFTYTDNGELLTKTHVPSSDVTSYVYDELGNLTDVTLPNGDDVHYVIDALNRRVAKEVNGVFERGWLYRDALRPIAEVNSAGNVQAVFVYQTHSNVPDLIVKGTTVYRVVSDHVGSVRQVVNVATGAIVQEMTYSTFGEVLSDSNPGFQPFGFAGGLWDDDTGLLRFGARDDDALSGRWTSKDPIGFSGGDLNLYGYAANNPVNFIDPRGTDVYNISDYPVAVKPENDVDQPFIVNPGEYYVGEHDGIYAYQIVGADETGYPLLLFEAYKTSNALNVQVTPWEIIPIDGYPGFRDSRWVREDFFDGEGWVWPQPADMQDLVDWLYELEQCR